MFSGRLDRALRVRGVRHDDFLPPDVDVERALKLIPQEEFQMRLRRIARYQELEMKRVELPQDAQAAQEPFKEYLAPLALDLKRRRLERETYQ